MLLIIEALLIVAALGQDHRAAAAVEKTFPLDMAENSVDDQYDGCEKNMANLVETEYLKKELKNSEEFNQAWKKDAIKKLKNPNQCIKTYRRTKVTFNENVKNREVRFGSFASSSRKKGGTFFGNVSCFEIETCEGADVAKYSKLPREEEVLIPPYEKFKVTDVMKKGQEGAWCDTVFILKSTGRTSFLNCALFKKQKRLFKKQQCP